MKTSSRAPTPEQLAFRKALEGAMADHGKTLDAVELLAVASHLVGQLVAMQDQRRFNAQQVMALVQNNIEQGNAEVIDGLLSATGGAC